MVVQRTLRHPDLGENNIKLNSFNSDCNNLASSHLNEALLGWVVWSHGCPSTPLPHHHFHPLLTEKNTTVMVVLAGKYQPRKPFKVPYGLRLNP
jgi:hypothetical protein